MVYLNLTLETAAFVNYTMYSQDFWPLYFRHRNGDINIFISLTLAKQFHIGFLMGITSHYSECKNCDGSTYLVYSRTSIIRTSINRTLDYPDLKMTHVVHLIRAQLAALIDRRDNSLE